MDFLRQVPVVGSMGPLIATFVLGFTTIILILKYFSRNHDYWKNRGVPFVKAYPFFGSVLENIRKPLHDTELRRYVALGRIYGHYEANRALLSVGDPEHLRNILVKDFQAFTSRRNFSTGDEITESMISILRGEEWKRVRTIITPTFTTGKIKRMISIFKECSRTLVKNFKEAAEKGETIEAKSLYGAFTMDIIASSAFSTKIDSHNDPNNEFVVTARHAFVRNLNWRAVFLLLCPRIMKFFQITVFHPKVLNFFNNVTLQIIEERKKTGQKRNDFLQLLLDTAKEVTEEDKSDLKDTDNDIAENYGKDESDIVFKHVVSKKSLSHNELVAQCIIFFLAGYDTTASTLSFATYLLATNPDVQEKLIQELDDALSENNGELTYEALQSMKYLDNVISETLRMYPPAIRTERVADQDYKLGDTGIVIPKDMIVTIPIYAIQRDPEFFPEPEKFDPDRFNAEERAKRNPFTYMPFGAGPRNCVGLRFALMEIKVCLAYVLSNFRIKKCPQTKVPLDFYIGQGLLQPKDIIVQLEVRTDTEKAL